MQTLSYGIKKPEQGDIGRPIFQAIEENAQIQNDHIHDGSNSPKINTNAINKTTQAILATNWATPVNGIYSQVLTVTGGLIVDSTTITFRDTATGAQLMLSFEKVTATTYRVYCNDSTKNVTAVYA